MADHSRVARWRQRLRDEGKKAITVWLSVEEELRLKGLAVQWHTSPSEIMRQALAQFHPGRPPSISNETGTTQPQHSYNTDIVPIQRWLQAELPGMVRRIVEDLAVEMLVTDTRDSGVTEYKQIHHGAVPDTMTDMPTSRTDGSQEKAITETAYSNAPETSAPVQRKGGRPRSTMGQHILDLLEQHPDGLTAEQIRAALEPSRPLGDILGGMRRTGAVQTHREGRGLRYTLPR
jgi:hypothetical protein